MTWRDFKHYWKPLGGWRFVFTAEYWRYQRQMIRWDKR